MKNFNRQLNILRNTAGGFTWTKGRFPGEYVLSTNDGRAHLTIEIYDKAFPFRNPESPKYIVNLAHGGTNKNARGKGHGLFLRAVPVYAAVRSKNINRVVHQSAFLNNAQKRNYNVPPSQRLVKYLGLVPKNAKKPLHEELIIKNATPELRNRLRRIVYRYPFDKKNYNRVAGKRGVMSHPLQSRIEGAFSVRRLVPKRR
jgi:hypothetical protein